MDLSSLLQLTLEHGALELTVSSDITVDTINGNVQILNLDAEHTITLNAPTKVSSLLLINNSNYDAKILIASATHVTLPANSASEFFYGKQWYAVNKPTEEFTHVLNPNNLLKGPSSVFPSQVNKISIAKFDSEYTLLVYTVGTSVKMKVSGMSDTSISFGTEITLNRSGYYISCTGLDSDHAIVTIEDTNHVGYIYLITRNGYSITTTTGVSIDTGSYGYYPEVTALTPTLVMVSYKNYNNQLAVRAFTISGSSITGNNPGTTSTYPRGTRITALTSSSALVCAIATNNQVSMFVAYISGSTVGLGNRFVLTTIPEEHAALDTLNASYVIFACGTVNGGQVHLLYINGTTISSKDSVYFAPNADAKMIDMSVSDSTHALIGYAAWNSTPLGEIIMITINGISITLGTKLTFDSNGAGAIAVKALDDKRIELFYRDVGNSNYGTACIIY